MTIIFLQVIIIIILITILSKHKIPKNSKTQPKGKDESNKDEFEKILTYEELLEDDNDNQKK